MTRMEPASPAAPWLDWIEGTAFLSYLDPAGRGSFFPCQRSSALIPSDVGEGDSLARQISNPDDVIVFVDVVAIPTVHSASPSAKASHNRGQSITEPFADEQNRLVKSANT